MCEIQVGNFLASKDEHGNWMYKAKEALPLLKKKNPQYREKPQFGLQYQIEGNSKAVFRKNLNNIVIAVIKNIK